MAGTVEKPLLDEPTLSLDLEDDENDDAVNAFLVDAPPKGGHS